MLQNERGQLIERFQEMRADLFDAIKGLSPHQMTEQTLDGWSIKDHLYHLAAWDNVRAEEVVRISAGHVSAWRMTDEQDEAFNQLLYEMRRDLGVEQARWELSTSRDRLIEAIQQATPRGLDDTLYGEAALLSTHETQHTDWIRRWRKERGY